MPSIIPTAGLHTFNFKEINMAHEVTAMAYTNEVPWHGLGNQLTKKQSIEVWAKQAGMNFSINESPVRFMTESAGSLGAIMSFPEQKVLYRSDTKAALSVVSNRYQVVQPREILEFYRDLTEISGFELEVAGILKSGKKLFALAKTNQSASLKGNDVVNGYLLLATACDGTLATTAQFTSVRVVCQNTLAIALNSGGNAVKVPHSTSFDAQAVKRQLGISVASWDEFMYRMKTLSNRKVKPIEATRFFLKVFTDSNSAATGLSNERAIKKVQELYDGRGKGSELPSSKDTAFGLVNSITEFIDHERRAKSTDHRLDSALFGQGAAIKQKALDQALLMIA
jgi:phage/plasmid-like protein (TIGR03299 family)